MINDLKAVYAAVDEASVLEDTELFSNSCDKKYPKISLSCRDNWANLSTYFEYPQEVSIEGFNRQIRKVTKSKSVFPTDDSLLKMLYLAMIDITKKWTGGGRTGALYMSNCRYTLPQGCQIGSEHKSV